MLVVGLTGGIGSGKSTVADLFAQHGVPIIDADVIAREVIEPHHSAFATLIDHFGNHILTPAGELDRMKLRKIIFTDEAERKWLENLLHPLIRNEIEKKVKQLSAPYCIVVIPLLFEVQPYTFIDRILVVDTPEHLQIARVVDRDKADIAHVASILKTQAARADRNALADDVILNDGKLQDLVEQVEKLHETYVRMHDSE